jgi:hypothetical protein
VVRKLLVAIAVVLALSLPVGSGLVAGLGTSPSRGVAGIGTSPTDRVRG